MRYSSIYSLLRKVLIALKCAALMEGNEDWTLDKKKFDHLHQATNDDLRRNLFSLPFRNTFTNIWYMLKASTPIQKNVVKRK